MQIKIKFSIKILKKLFHLKLYKNNHLYVKINKFRPWMINLVKF